MYIYYGSNYEVHSTLCTRYKYLVIVDSTMYYVLCTMYICTCIVYRCMCTHTPSCCVHGSRYNSICTYDRCTLCCRKDTRCVMHPVADHCKSMHYVHVRTSTEYEVHHTTWSYLGSGCTLPCPLGCDVPTSINPHHGYIHWWLVRVPCTCTLYFVLDTRNEILCCTGMGYKHGV